MAPLAILLSFAGLAAAQSTPSYQQVDWPAEALSAAGAPAGPWNFIQVASVAVNARGNILVLHRGAHPIMEFEPGGKFVRSWGDGLFSEGKIVTVAAQFRKPGASAYSAVYGPPGCDSCGAHSIRIDPQGAIWAVDSPGQVIYKMDPDGKVLFHLGRKGVTGAGRDTFNLPTDIAFAPNGDLYVSDGYGGARVVKFTAQGKYLLEWGKRGTGPGEFGMPHNVVADSQGKVYVSDRDNRRVQVFDSNGKFLAEWNTGGISAISLTKDNRIWTGGVLRDLSGKEILRLPDAAGHGGLALPASGDVYIAQLSGKVHKFVKR